MRIDHLYGITQYTYAEHERAALTILHQEPSQYLLLWLDLKLKENLTSYNEHEMSEPKDIDLVFNLHQGTIIQLTRIMIKTE